MTGAKKNNFGFTLVEILVVATIIGVLTSIAIVNYQSLGKQARDGKRKADLEQVRGALEIYRADYPRTGYPSGDFAAMINTLRNDANGPYINTVPSDPKGYSYYYDRLTLSTYVLCAYLEAGNGADCGDNCSAPSNCNYQVENP